MTKFLTVAIISLTLIFCGQTTPPDDKGKERLDKVCDSFMKLFVEGKNVEAMQLLKRNSLMTAETIDKLNETIEKQIREYFPGYGKIVSYEFILEKKIKDFVAKRFYILKLEKYYLRFDFTIYKSATGWNITHFKYDDELNELFK